MKIEIRKNKSIFSSIRKMEDNMIKIIKLLIMLLITKLR